MQSPKGFIVNNKNNQILIYSSKDYLSEKQELEPQYSTESTAAPHNHVKKATLLIKYFKCNKYSFAEGETIILTWQTEGADQIQIQPFQESFPPSGTLCIKPTQQLNLKCVLKNRQGDQEESLIQLKKQDSSNPLPNAEVLEDLQIGTDQIASLVPIKQLNPKLKILWKQISGPKAKLYKGTKGQTYIFCKDPGHLVFEYQIRNKGHHQKSWIHIEVDEKFKLRLQDKIELSELNSFS